MLRPEPRLGDAVIRRDWPPGRIEMITEYEGVQVIGVKFEGAFFKQFYTMSQLDWQDDHWIIKDGK